MVAAGAAVVAAGAALVAMVAVAAAGVAVVAAGIVTAVAAARPCWPWWSKFGPKKQPNILVVL